MGQQVGGGGNHDSRSFFLLRFPPLTHAGAGTPDSEFGGWGVAGAQVSALARVLAPMSRPTFPIFWGSLCA